MSNIKEKQIDQIERMKATVGNHIKENDLIIRELEFLVTKTQVNIHKQKELNDKLNTVLYELTNLKEEIKNENN